MTNTVYVVRMFGRMVDVSCFVDIFLTKKEADKFVKCYKRRNKDFNFETDAFEIGGECLNNILLGDK